MSNPIGEAFVRVRADTTGFEQEAGSGIIGTATKLAAVVGGIFASVKLFEFGKSAVEEAALTQKATENIRVQFGAASASVLKFSDDAASTFAISKSASEAFASQLGLVTQNLGISNSKSAEMTIGLEKLAGSIGLIKGQDPSTVFTTLTTALQGSTRGLKSLGITIDSTQISNEALKLGLIRTTSDAITPAIKAQAIYALSTQHLGQFMDQAGKHSTDLIDTQARLRAEFANIKDEIGAALLPTVEQLSSAFATALPGAFKIAGEAIQVVVNAISQFTNVFSLVSTIADLIRTFVRMEEAGRSLGAILSHLGQTILVDLGVSAQNAHAAIQAVGGVFSTVASIVQGIFAPVMASVRTVLSAISGIAGGVVTDIRNLGREFAYLASVGTPLHTIIQQVARSALVDLGLSFGQARAVIADVSAVLDVVGQALGRVAGVAREAIASFQGLSTASLFSQAVDAARAALDGLLAAATPVFDFLLAHQEIFAAIAAGIAITVGAIIALTAAMAVGTAVSTAFAAALALAFSPVIIVVATIGLLVAALILLYRHNADVRELIRVVWAEIKTDIVDAIGIIRAVIGAFVAFATEFWHVFGSTITSVTRIAFNTIREVISSVMHVILGVVNVILGAIHGNWSQVWRGLQQIVSGVMGGIAALLSGMVGILGATAGRIGTAILNGIVNQVSKLAGKLASIVKGIPGDIGNLSHVLYSAGVQLITGFISGITSAIGGVKDTLTGLAKSAVSWKGPPDVDRKLLIPAGQLMIQGFVEGLQREIPKVRATLAPIAPSIAAQLSARAVAASLGPPGVALAPVGGAANGSALLSALSGQNAMSGEGVHIDKIIVMHPDPHAVLRGVLNEVASRRRRR